MESVIGVDVLTKRHERLRIALWVSLFFAIASLLFELAELMGFFSINTDPAADPSNLEWLYFAVGVGTLIVAVITIVFWCMWIHRAARNLVEARIDDFEYTPAWAVGWYFIPIATWFKPFQVMRKIWNASAGEATTLDFPAPNINLWWAAWVISSVAGNISTRIAFQAESPETLYLGTAIGAVSSVAVIIAIPLAQKILAAITVGQKARF